MHCHTLNHPWIGVNFDILQTLPPSEVTATNQFFFFSENFLHSHAHNDEVPTLPLTQMQQDNIVQTPCRVPQEAEPFLCTLQFGAKPATSQ